MVSDDRGQAFTLEAVTAAIVLLVAVGFALQMTAVTPLSASTSSQHLENQLQSTGEGLLASTDESGELKEAVLYWDHEEEEFHNSSEVEAYYLGQSPDNDFGNVVDKVLGERNIAYNIYVHFQDDDGNVETQQMVGQGQPSDHAVSASRTVELTKDDRLVEEDGSSGEKLRNVAGDFYVEENSGDLHYNLVRVEVVAWRI